jgi:hypothetical protein
MLTPAQYAELLRKLDEVCQQARDLSRQLRAQMEARARSDRQLISNGNGGPERQRTPRSGGVKERRAAKRSEPPA